MYGCTVALMFSASVVELPGGARALRAALPLEGDEGDTGWVQLVPGEGHFEGHVDGAFSFTPQVLDEIIGNFNRTETPTLFDYEHDTENPNIPGYEKISSGKIQRLEKRDGDKGAQLWALVKWTARAAEQIRAGERNYSSPVINFKSRDRATNEEIGAELLSAALTDKPFLDGQDAVRLSRFAMADEPKSNEEEAKPMADDTEGAEMADEGGEEEVDFNAQGRAFAKATGMTDAAALAFFTENQDAFAEMANAAMEADGTPAEMARMSRIEGGKKDADIARMSKRLSELEADKADRDRADADAAKVRVMSRVKELTDAGHIGDDEEAQENAVFMFTKFPKRAESLYSKATVVPTQPQAGDEAPPVDAASASEGDLTEGERVTLTRQMNQLGLKDRKRAVARIINARGTN